VERTVRRDDFATERVEGRLISFFNH
jgi:hypothetical protein